MPYDEETGQDIPKPAKRMFKSAKRKRQFAHVFNRVLADTGSEQRAYASAYAATKRSNESMSVISRINTVLRKLGEAASSRLDASTKRKINAALSKGVTSGFPYAKSFGNGLSAAYDVLAKFGIEPAQMISLPLGREGRVSVPLAFTNTDDSFSPTQIENSDLIVAFANMNTGVEIIAYVS